MIDNVLDLITKGAWLLFAGYTIISFFRTAADIGMLKAFILLFSWQIIGPLVVVMGLNLLSLALVFIEPPEVGVVISLLSPQGIRERPFSSGLHWVVPLAEQVQEYPIYWQTYTMSSNPAEGQEIGDDSIRARTSDGQEVLLDSSLIFRIDTDQVVQVHIDWQQRYIEDLIRPVIRGFVRTQVSQFKVDEVNSSARKDLEATLDRLLREELEDKGLILDQFLLRDITFSEEYARAIEQKQVALEKIEQSKHNAASILIEAEAQAKAYDLIAKALKDNPEVLTNEYIQKLSPNIRVMLLPNNAPFILPLPNLEQVAPPTTTLQPPTLPAQTTPTAYQGQ